MGVNIHAFVVEEPDFLLKKGKGSVMIISQSRGSARTECAFMHVPKAVFLAENQTCAGWKAEGKEQDGERDR